MLRPAPDVFCTHVDNRCVLLDLRHEQYLGLDEVGTTIWQAIERGATATDVVDELARQYDAPTDVLARDVALFLADLERRGLVDRRAASVNAHPPRLITCLLLLALMDVHARVLGLRRTLALAHRLAGSRPTRANPALVQETTRRLVLAAAFYPRRALCLEQSLALCVLLRRRGIGAALRLGVQSLPFYAHAWVEVDGRAIEEHDGLPLQLATFSGVGV